jgi:uncharacterized protein
MSTSIAGTEPGQRHLNGPQTTGRESRHLSAPEHPMTRDDDVADRRFKAARLRLFVTSDDQNPETPAMLTYRAWRVPSGRPARSRNAR